MPHNTSLEELFRHAVTFPGAGVAMAALQTALTHLEEELERSADQLGLRLNARHNKFRGELHPEDEEDEQYDLDRTVNVLLPRVVRGGFILTLWSTFEVAALCFRNRLLQTWPDHHLGRRQQPGTKAQMGFGMAGIEADHQPVGGGGVSGALHSKQRRPARGQQIGGGCLDALHEVGRSLH